MTRALLASGTFAALALGATSALAGNLEEPVIAPAPAPVAVVPVAQGNDWTGFYAGGSLGYAEAEESDPANFEADGATYGLHAGYDYDFGSFVLGGELEISGFDVSAGGVDADSVARAKLRAGYDAGNFMPYVTAGAAQLNTGGALEGDDTGAFYGVGMDYLLTDSIRVGGEVLKHEFDNFDDSGLDLEATTASLRMSFQF
ncbi:outer membrane protein [Pseudooctadecabacter sp.]|uniref:outer membrane protein n=1 Tax=Pseudooctadecabacter sp. TaxID=1966338 RepID=UPI003F6C0DE8